MIRITPEDEIISEKLHSLLAKTKNYDDRAVVITYSAYLDDALNSLIIHRLVDCHATSQLFGDRSSAMPTFSNRINMARALGCISEVEYRDLEIIRKVRNAAAHRWTDFSCEEGKEKDRISNISRSIMEIVGDLELGTMRERLLFRVIELLIWFELLRERAGELDDDGEVVLPKIIQQEHVFLLSESERLNWKAGS